MTKDTMQLCNPYFRLKIGAGVITSFCAGEATRGMDDTQFVLPGESFGSVIIKGCYREKSYELICGDMIHDSISTNIQARYDGYDITYQDVPITVTVKYQFVKNSLLQTVAITNHGDDIFTLHDLGFPYPNNNDFQWDVPAVDKVIGHHYVSGHGSHLVFQRCDGEGPMLLVLPQNGSKLVHYDLTPMQTKAGAFDKPNQEAYTAYAYAAQAQVQPLEAGAKLPYVCQGKTLSPGESETFEMVYCFADDNAHARELFVEHGLVDVEVLPGLTVCQDNEVRLSLRCKSELTVSLPEGTTLLSKEKQGDRTVLILRFSTLGEQVLPIVYGDNHFMEVRFFVNQAVETLLEKRAAFIKKCQHIDKEKWYYGLFGEWNNETGALLGPDNYDKIGGWRIYEVSCDDPGLSKPAFLSGKLAELPVYDQVKALDLYVENFVWGGLQCTDKEQHPYGIYGIPDWKKNRESEDDGIRGKLHLWRIYDYPHIALMYFNLYRIANNFTDMPLTQTKGTYLLRAYHTAVTMFTLPYELDHWTAYETGLYNELVYEDIIIALRKEGFSFEADRLERHWIYKIKFFVCKCKDVFGSEYPFDTTGFESTHAFAKRALAIAEQVERNDRFNPALQLEQAWSFMVRQLNCNISCRGVLEPLYYLYGSDYRGSNTHYTLTYMSQMGGWAILDYALYLAEDPFSLLRLGYGSIMSAWATLNSGEKEDNYGYWFPGEEHDGAASGGYEPLFLGHTWLDQPHHGGPWYYSCEIDLGYCGYLRAASTIVAEDPIFGRVCYGGQLVQQETHYEIIPQDGICRRFHYVGKEKRLHLTLDVGRIEKIYYDQDSGIVTVQVQTKGLACDNVHLQISAVNLSVYQNNTALIDGEITANVTGDTITIKFQVQ